MIRPKALASFRLEPARASSGWRPISGLVLSLPLALLMSIGGAIVSASQAGAIELAGFPELAPRPPIEGLAIVPRQIR